MNAEHPAETELQRLIAARDQAVHDFEEIRRKNLFLSLALVAALILAMVLAWHSSLACS